MRILLVNTLYPPIQHGGQEIFVSLLAEGLARAGDTVTVCTLHPGPVEDFDIQNDVRVFRLPLDNVYWPFDPHVVPGSASKLLWHARDTWNSKAAARLGRILDREKPDVVHTHGLSGFSVAVWHETSRRNLRLIHTLHDFYLLCRNFALFRQGKPCSTRCRDCAVATAPRRWATARVDTVISISQFVLDTHRTHGYFTKSSSSVIYNIVETPAIAAHRDFHLPLVFGYIGRLEEEKGIDLLLRATTQLHGDWRLRIAGSGKPDYVAALRQRFSAPNIEWAGYVDAHSFYSAIDVAVVPSLWSEPLGRTAIESIAARKPLICAASGGIPEVAALGCSVTCYSPEDENTLSSLLQAAIDHPPDIAPAGFRNAASEQLFSERLVVQRHRELYGHSSVKAVAV